MILQQTKITSGTERKLYIDVNKFSHTWEYYYKQYNNVLNLMISVARQRKNQINFEFMPFMFIFRHTVELMIKCNLNSRSIPFETNHRIDELSKKMKLHNDNDFLNNLKVLRCEECGDCFKYLTRKDGTSFFNDGQLFVYEACQYFIHFSNNSPYFTYKLNDLLKENEPEYNSKRKKLIGELTFYPRECQEMGVIGTQYDYMIQLIVEHVLSGKISVNDVYLPLMFLIRHSLEIKLKSFVTKIGNQVGTKNKNGSLDKHSVSELFQTISSYIEEAIDQINDNPEFKDKTQTYRDNAKKFTESMNFLDKSSLVFRFPVKNDDTKFKLEIKKETFLNIYHDYQRTDSFLSLGDLILEYYGYSKLGDDTL